MATQRIFLWSTLVPVFFLALATESAEAKPRDLSQYILRVHIFQSQWTASGGFLSHGFGVANLIDGENVRGFNFVYDCPIQYAQSVGNEMYVAKWKKPGKSLEVVGSQTGDASKSETCEFDVTLHDFAYDMQNGTIATFTPEQYKVRNGMALPTAGTVDTNPSHYPLRLAVLKVGWEQAVNGSRNGSGQGNLVVGSKLSSVDFTASCAAAFGTTPDDRYYAAVWVREGSELAVLLSTEGGGAVLCRLQTILHTDIYVREPNGAIKAVSQADYKPVAP